MHLAKGLILVSIIASASELVCGDGFPTRKEIKDHEEELGQMCKRVGTIKKISEMEQLIKTLSLVLNEQPKLLVGISSESSAFKRFSQSPMAPCLQQANAIRDLAEIIGERENVCSSQHLDLIEHYYEQYIKPRLVPCESTTTNLLKFASTCSTSKLITAKFFELYTNQVSFSCKAHLLSSLETINTSHLVSERDYTKALPWLTQSNKKLCEKIEKQEKLASKLDRHQQKLFSQDSPDHNEERILQCKAVRTLLEISTVHELVEASERDKQITGGSLDQLLQNKIVIGKGEEGSSEEDKTAGKSGLFIIVPREQQEVVKDMQMGCSKMRPIYEQTVLPIVRLVRMGFDPTFSNFDKACSENKLIQKWFGITLVCSSILSSHLTDIDKYTELKEDFEAKKKSLVVIDKVSPEDDALPILSSSAVLSLVKYPIEDELWVYKYSTTKMQRFKDGVLKKVLKLLKVEDIDDHIVLRRNVTAINGWIVKGVILIVSFLTFK